MSDKKAGIWFLILSILMIVGLGAIFPMWYGGDKKALSVLIATWVGAIATCGAAFFAYRIVIKQNELISQQSRIQLFQERYAVYQIFQKFEDDLKSTLTLSEHSREALLCVRDKSRFLFGDEIPSSINLFIMFGDRLNKLTSAINALEQLQHLSEQGEKDYKSLIEQRNHCMFEFNNWINGAMIEFHNYFHLADARVNIVNGFPDSKKRKRTAD